MDRLATIGTAGITGVLTFAGVLIQHAAPRELRRARQLSSELEAMDQHASSTAFAKAARDDLVVAWILRSVVSPWSAARVLTFTLLGASIVLALTAFVPIIQGIIATANGIPDGLADIMALMLLTASASLLLFALIPARRYDKQVKELRSRFRAAWSLPEELRMTSLTAPVAHPAESTPLQPPTPGFPSRGQAARRIFGIAFPPA